jgi:hypothetical protein
MMAVTMLVCSAAAMAQDNAGVAEAKAVSARWLELSDAGNYGAAWEQSADAFRAAVPRQDWENAGKALHAKFGPVTSRTLKSATYSNSLRGAPPGEYVVVQYLAQLEGGRTAVETVTPQRAKDGSWKVSGYFIN